MKLREMIWFISPSNDGGNARGDEYRVAMTQVELIEEALTYSVIGAFFEVYNQLGFGFLEQVYVNALEAELIARGHRVRREVMVRVYYKGKVIGRHRLDMIVDDKLVVEVKSTHHLNDADPRKVYAYLHSTKLEVGLLLHFGPEAKFYRLASPNAVSSGPSASSVPSA